MKDKILDIDFDVEKLSKEELGNTLENVRKQLASVSTKIISAKNNGLETDELEKQKKQLSRKLYQVRLQMFFKKDSC